MSTPFRRVRFAVVFLSLALLATALLVYLVSAAQPSRAEQAAAKLRAGMNLWQVREASGIGGRSLVCNGKSTPTHFAMDGSTLIIEFSEAPHQVVAVHTYRADTRFWLLMMYPDLREFIPLLNPPYDPVRRAARPLRPRTDLPPDSR